MLAAKSTRSFSDLESLETRGLPKLHEHVVRLICVVTLGLGTLWVGGCATQADLQQVQSERRTTLTQVANTNASIESLRQEVQRVQGAVQELDHRLSRVSKQGTGTAPQLRSLEERLTTLEGRMRDRDVERRPEYGLGEPTLPSAAPETSTPSLPFGLPAVSPLPAARSAATTDTPECQDLYGKALGLFQEREYTASIQEFRVFQRRCPDSEMADDAQYWIGESHYVQNDYNRAILEFNDVLSYRRGDRVAAALLRQAQAFVAIGDQTDARLILQKLISDHPSAAQTPEAQTLLQTLGR